MSVELRRDLVQTLERWERAHPGQADGFAEWQSVAGDATLLTRAGRPAHFTASALPITADGSRVCLVLHGRMGRWVQPGGHLEASDRSVVEAAGREMSEETGLAGTVDPVPVKLSRHPAPCGPDLWHLDLQLVAVCDPRPPVISSESREVAWFDVDRLPGEMASGVAGLVVAGRERLSRNGSPGRRSPEG